METLRRSWPWFFVLGAISLVGGVLALIHPGFASLAVVYWAAWSFLILGVSQLFHAMAIKAWSGFLVAASMGVVALLLGVSLLLNPFAGAISLTALVGILFLVYGFAKVILAFRMRSQANWLWMLLSGAISLILAIMIFGDFPWSALSVLGLLLAVELLTFGVALIMTGMALRAGAGRV